MGRGKEPKWKEYNVKPTKDELKKWKQEDDTYKLCIITYNYDD